MALLDRGEITGDEAYQQANNKMRFRAKREGKQPDPHALTE